MANSAVMPDQRDRAGLLGAMRWYLLAARPIKYTAPSFNGKGTDLAVEELVLSIERIVKPTTTSTYPRALQRQCDRCFRR